VGIDALSDLIDMSPSPVSTGIVFADSVTDRAQSMDSRATHPLGENRPVERKEGMMRMIGKAISSVLEGTMWRKSKPVEQAADTVQQQSFPTRYTSLREKNIVNGAVHCSFPSKRVIRGAGSRGSDRSSADIISSVLLTPRSAAAAKARQRLAAGDLERIGGLPYEDYCPDGELNWHQIFMNSNQVI